MSGYAPQRFPAADNTVVDDAAAFSSELDDLCQLEYSPAPLIAGAGGGAGDDRDEKSMYVTYIRTEYLINFRGRVW